MRKEIRITHYALRITHYALRITHYALRITHYALRITHYALRITHYALRITHYALRITHYALRITWYNVSESRGPCGQEAGAMPGEILYNVPVFPLNTVLFPGMPIHLHVFEERYRVMVQDIQHGDKRFCVALISEGQEVGGQA